MLVLEMFKVCDLLMVIVFVSVYELSVVVVWCLLTLKAFGIS